MLRGAARGIALGGLAFGALGAALALLAILRGHFPYLPDGERLRLALGWAALAAVYGGALGGVAAAAVALLPGRTLRRIVPPVAIALGAVALLASALLPRASRFDALGPAVRPPAPQAAPAANASRPNLVLVSIDTLRADHLGAYGYARPTSPALDRFAADGATFEASISQAPETKLAMAALLTGLYPHAFEYEHSLRGDRGPYVGDGFVTVAERLQAAGYATAGFVSNPVLVAENGYAQGFDVWDETGLVGNDAAGRHRNVSDVVDPALRWLEAAKPPFFLFVHVMDPHHPYEPAAPGPWEDLSEEWRRELLARWGARSVAEDSERMKELRDGERAFGERELEHLVDRYDSEILQTDAGFARLLAALEARGEGARNAYVVVTADHGEEFMDHGGLLHGHTFFDELVRVPLLVRGPGIPPGLRVRAQVRSLDVAATLLAWAGLPGSDLDGESLEPQLGRAKASDRPALAYRSTRYLALRTPEWKLVAAFEPYPDPALSFSPAQLVRSARIALARPKRDEIGLFHLREDPGETRDLLRERPAEGARLDALLRAALAASPLRAVPSSVAQGPSDDTVDRLRALGYTD